MATKGRGGDSMLVHMTPGEVQALQALAERHGGTLTINPETGQPEANFLKKLLPAIAGAALNFFAPGVGTAVGGMFGLGAAAGTGIAVGGISALATGSLSRGLMAGMGAYGGASLAGSLANAGTGALSSEAGNAALAAEGLTGDAALTSAADDVAQRAIGERLASATPYDKMSAGFKAVTDSPAAFGNFAKNNVQSGLMAISPIMADEGVQTATPKQDTGNIRRFSFDRYGQTYTPQGVFPAAGYTGMAQGGIVALANGGTADQPLYLGLNKGSSAADVAAAYSQFAGGAGGDTAANQREAVAFLQSRGIGDDVITQGYQQFLSPPQQAQAQSQGLGMTSAPVTTSAPATRSAYAPTASGAWSGASHTVDGIELVPGAPGYDPAKAAMRLAEISTYGGTAGAGAAETLRANNLYDTGMAQWQTEYNRLHQQDIDAGRVPVGTAAAKVGAPKASATSATAGAPVPGTAAYNNMVGDWFSKYPNATAADIENAIRTNSLNRQDVFNSMGILGLSNAARYSAFHPDVGVPDTPQGGLAGLSSNINQWIQKYPTATRAEAEKAMNTWGYNEADIVRATGKTLDQLFTGPIEDVTFLPGGVSGGGNTIVNPNGTITTAPNIPGRPANGFTGMGQVRDAYTQGGGSLGYVNPAPKTMEEFDQRFNRQTGDSLAAYEYLIGKGANPATQQRVGEIARPYSEAIMGIPAAAGRPNQKFIYEGGRYIENPNYAPVTYDTKGNRVVGMTSAEVLKGIQGLKDPADDGALFDWATANNVSEAQLAAALGISIAEARARIAAGKTKSTAVSAPPVEEVAGAAEGGVMRMALGGLGSLAKGGVAELPDGAFVVPARITSELGNGSTNAGAQKLFAMEQRLLGKNAQPVNLGRYSGGGNLVRGKGDGVSDSVPATIGGRQPARIADGESVVSRKAVEKLGDGSIEAGARKLYAMMDRVQKARGKTTGKNRVAANTRADKYLPA
jgi:hypothetical protein